ncbi:MAG: hypothetical protein IPH16_10180 [Haliscomenobacter sp.]|nr:hypothetical protein [Haliscomenobacter sp.]
MDGYSGTGKSSLLQAGIIPRIEAQGWACAYGRREEDKIRGLKGVFGKLLDELLKSGNQKGVCILDQLEEAVTDPIAGLGNELPEFGVALKKAILDYPHLKFILGFRSEQATRIKKVLDDLGLIYDDQNTLFPLDRTGAIEAVSGVTGDAGLQRKYKLEFRPQNLP